MNFIQDIGLIHNIIFTYKTFFINEYNNECNVL